jgi:predicted RNA-binding protein YlxR (DUF448 family)
VPAKQHVTPQRTCIACRTKLDKDQLIRIVKSPLGSLVVDMTEKKKVPGRGAYICASESCFKKTFKSNIYSRALRMDGAGTQ